MYTFKLDPESIVESSGVDVAGWDERMDSFDEFCPFYPSYIEVQASVDDTNGGEELDEIDDILAVCAIMNKKESILPYVKGQQDFSKFPDWFMPALKKTIQYCLDNELMENDVPSEEWGWL